MANRVITYGGKVITQNGKVLTLTAALQVILRKCVDDSIFGYLSEAMDPGKDYFYAKKAGAWANVYKDALSAVAADIDCTYLDELDSTPASCSDLTQNRHPVIYGSSANAVIDTAQYYSGSSCLRGNGASAVVSAAAEFYFGTSAFLFSFRSKANASSTSPFFGMESNGGTSQILQMNMDDSGFGALLFWDSNGSDAGKRIGLGSPGDFTDGAWHAITISRSGNTITFDIDGTNGSQTYTGNIGKSGGGYIALGSSTGTWWHDILTLVTSGGTILDCKYEGPDESQCFFDSAIAS